MVFKQWLYFGAGLVVLYIFFILSKGFIGFLIQTAFYAVLVMALLLVLKTKGFFKS